MNLLLLWNGWVCVEHFFHKTNSNWILYLYLWDNLFCFSVNEQIIINFRQEFHTMWDFSLPIYLQQMNLYKKNRSIRIVFLNKMKQLTNHFRGTRTIYQRTNRETISSLRLEHALLILHALLSCANVIPSSENKKIHLFSNGK